MALIKLNNQSLTNVSALPAGVGGKVLQVVQGTPPSSQYSQTSTSLLDATGFTASITPQSINSKILVMFTGRIDNTSSGNVNNRGSIVLLRGTTVIQRQFVGTYYGDGSPNNRNTYDSVSLTGLDSPATTSQVTYKIQLASAATSNSITIEGTPTSTDVFSSFVLTEIAG